MAFASGYLLYVDERSLMARPFDPKRLEFTGPAVPVVDQELDRDYAFGKTAFSFSQEGNVVFQSVADTISELVSTRSGPTAPANPLSWPRART